MILLVRTQASVSYALSTLGLEKTAQIIALHCLKLTIFSEKCSRQDE